MFCVFPVGKYTMLKMRSQDFEELFLFKYNIIPQKLLYHLIIQTC